MTDPDSSDDRRFREYVLQRGIATEEQVEECLRMKPKESSLREALVNKGYLTPEQIQSTLVFTSEKSLPKVRFPDLPPEVAGYANQETNLIGKYILTTLLGSGGLGRVYRAWDKELCRWVALKQLKTVGDDNALDWFRREAQVAARLDHPNITRIYDVGENEDVPFIAMQLVEGQTLSSAQKEMSLSEKVTAVQKVVEALRYAHGKGVIHRDLKPENVMVDGNGEVFVLDFGLAKEIRVTDQTLSMSGVIIGTPSYMPPEQVRGKADRQSDVYGLGAILYALVTGRPPFTGLTATDVLTQVLFNELVWPRVLSPDVPRDLEAILLKSLEKERSRRYASVEELQEDLDSYLNKEPLKHARRPTVGYVVVKKIRKQPLLWGLGAALVGSIFLGTGFGVYTLLERNRVEREGREKAERERERADGEARKAQLERERTNKAFSRAKSLVDAQRVIDWGEGNEKLLAILRKGASESDPDSVWLTEAGRLLYKTNDREMHPDARRYLEEAIRLDTERAYEALYYLHLIKNFGKEEFWSRYLSEIVRRANAINDKENVFVLNSRCMKAMDDGNLDEALDLANRVVDIGGNLSKTLNIRGKIRNMKGDLKGAIEDFTRSIEINPRFAGAWINRGASRGSSGDLNGAIRDFTRAIEINRKYALAWLNRGMSLMKKGNWEGAIRDFSQAIEIAPKYAPAWANRGIARMRKGNLEEAIEDYTRAIEINPKLRIVWANRGIARSRRGDLDGAIQDLSKAVELAPRAGNVPAIRKEIEKLRKQLAEEE